MDIHIINIFVPAVVLIPSLLYVYFKPNKPVRRIHVPSVFIIFEKIGQIGMVVLPLFFSLHIYPMLLTLMAVMLSLYYLVWLRYFRTRNIELLYSSYFFIPIPLALFPILYFLFAALSFNVPLLYISWALLAIGHLGVSLTYASAYNKRAH